MKQIEVTILGQSYLLGCPEGGEALLPEAAKLCEPGVDGLQRGGVADTIEHTRHRQWVSPQPPPPQHTNFRKHNSHTHTITPTPHPPTHASLAAPIPPHPHLSPSAGAAACSLPPQRRGDRPASPRPAGGGGRPYQGRC